MTEPGYERTMFWGNACLLHQYHLIVQGFLLLLDRSLKHLSKPFRYFAALATLSHSWRANLAKLRSAAVSMGIKNKHIRFCLPPLAVAGRWGSIDSARVVRRLATFCFCKYHIVVRLHNYIFYLCKYSHRFHMVNWSGNLMY